MKEVEKMALVFQYIRLAINSKRIGGNKQTGEMKEIQKKLSLSHKEIVELAKRSNPRGYQE